MIGESPDASELPSELLEVEDPACVCVCVWGGGGEVRTTKLLLNLITSLLISLNGHFL